MYVCMYVCIRNRLIILGYNLDDRLEDVKPHTHNPLSHKSFPKP